MMNKYCNTCLKTQQHWRKPDGMICSVCRRLLDWSKPDVARRKEEGSQLPS